MIKVGTQVIKRGDHLEAHHHHFHNFKIFFTDTKVDIIMWVSIDSRPSLIHILWEASFRENIVHQFKMFTLHYSVSPYPPYNLEEVEVYLEKNDKTSKT